MKLGQINYRWLCLAPSALFAKKIIKIQILLLKKKKSLSLLTIDWKYNSLTVTADINTAPVCVYRYTHI